MLVLSRKQEESILIGDHIKVQILGLKGNTVRIGVEAPDDVRIVRDELLTKQPIMPKSILDAKCDYAGHEIPAVSTATSA